MGTGDGGDNKIEPIITLLVGLVVFNTLVLIAVAKFMSSDGQTFQVIAGVLNGCLGAFLLRIKPKGTTNGDALPMPPSPATITTRKTEETTAATTVPGTDK